MIGRSNIRLLILLMGMPLSDFTSMEEDLMYIFPEPGNYKISLKATNGVCEDSSGPFNLKVVDPTLDGRAYLIDVDCHSNDSLRVVIQVANFGYDTIKIGTPISFYDENPELATTNPTLLKTFSLPDTVFGYEPNEWFTLYVHTPDDNPRLDELYVVFNDPGSSVFPIPFPEGDENTLSIRSRLPASGITELSYSNNFDSKKGFQFKLDLQSLDPTACANTDYMFDAQSINDGGRTTNIDWQPATNLSCTDCLDPSLALGIQSVSKTLVITNKYFCEESATVNINVPPYNRPIINNSPEVCQWSISPDFSSSVTGDNLTWYVAADGGLGASTPMVNTDVAGSFEYWVSQAIDGCEGPRAMLAYTIKPAPIPTVQNPVDLCVGDTPPIALGVSGVSLKWYTTSTGGTGDTAPTVSTAVGGFFEYWVTQTTNNCESLRAYIAVNVSSVPNIQLISNQIDICLNNSPPDLSSVATGTNLKWYSSSNDMVGATTTPTIKTDLAGSFNYWVTQTVDGCESSKTMLSYNVHQIDVLTDGPYEIDKGESQDINLTVTHTPDIGLPTITWEDESGQIIGNGSQITVSPIDPTTYTAQVEYSFGCSVEKEVYVNVLHFLQTAQIFSPNGDGMNEFWHIENIEKFPNATVSVYNRWGQIVYKTTKYSNDWNGHSNGKALPIGTYYYIIDQSEYQREALTGSVTIIK